MNLRALVAASALPVALVASACISRPVAPLEDRGESAQSAPDPCSPPGACETPCPDRCEDGDGGKGGKGGKRDEDDEDDDKKGGKGGKGGKRDGGDEACTRTQGYWKNHDDWPADVLTLGNVRYTRDELVALLRTSSEGDASTILTRQLVAAKLNVASGAPSASIAEAVADADAWLVAHVDADGRLPFAVAPSTPEGQKAVELAGELDRYNNGKMGVDHCD